MCRKINYSEFFLADFEAVLVRKNMKYFFDSLTESTATLRCGANDAHNMGFSSQKS